MTEITVDAAVSCVLRDAPGSVKVRDASGMVLGYFLPLDKPQAEVLFGVKSPLSPEERERRAREESRTGRPLSEFWDEMQQKYPDQFQ